MTLLRDTVSACLRPSGRAAFVAYLTAGYPHRADTVPLLLALEQGGADLIELGVPFTDPLADGPTIQKANQVAIDQGIELADCFEMIAEARKAGLKVPVVFMGYSNPFLAMGTAQVVERALACAVAGFIIVDLPPEEGTELIAACDRAGLSYVPLIAPTSSLHRVPVLAKSATSFVYIVSVAGVTGARDAVASDLPALVKRVREHTALPLAVGFGISTRDQVHQVALVSDAVVVGSAIIRAAAEGATTEQRAASVRALMAELVPGCDRRGAAAPPASAATGAPVPTGSSPADWTFGKFGGRFIPETLSQAHEELWVEYCKAKADPAFQAQVAELRRDFIGGPTPLHLAARLTERCGGARIWLKREDCAHTGAHKITNAVGQALLAKRLGKHRIIAETGAGQHGVATATACALFGLDCTIYMGSDDVARQSLNVFRMKVLGAKVVPVDSGSRTLKDAINEAMRDWVTNVTTTHYIIGSVVGPHPFPTIVRDFQSVIGREARAQMLEKAHKLPDYVVACVGGGSNAMGIFYDMIPDKDVKLVGVEAGGAIGISGPHHCAPLSAGTPGVLHGARTYLMQTPGGQISETHSISAGLDYPGVGPEHAFLKDSGRAQYVSATDSEALEAMQTMARFEGVIPALETSHAVHYAMELAKTLPKDKDVLIMISGRGDKDMVQVAKLLGVTLN